VKVGVELGERRYDVVIEAGARRRLKALIDERAPAAKLVALVTSASLAAQPWFDLDSGLDQFVVLVPEGESAKSVEALGELVETLAAARLSRDDVVVGVGGGAVTDLAGFAAASYLRGVGLIQVPTTLVAQVDAAIGGKTGVNLAAGKNLLGAFYQPLGVLCDAEVLATLSERERGSGLGEVAKCWLLEGRSATELAAAPFETLIDVSVELKARLVAGDEREGGSRALLNYGHTLAHAMEKIALARDPDELRHGEAVAVGLAFAARLARDLGRVGEEVVAEHDAVLDTLGLARGLPEGYDSDVLIEAMRHDKKARHDLRFVLAGPEGFSLVNDVDETLVRGALARFKGER
jgi:5-deoxy-5-amino-3-dehydroquinate synthase